MAGSTFGNLFRITTWGESHGKGIGVVIDGCPANVKLSEDDIQAYLNRRKPGTSQYTTPRKESDSVSILSGVFEGVTTGCPISLVVMNESQRSHDYSEIKTYYRPGHADYTFDEKYGFRDYRGGGRSSGRETIGRVAGGAIAANILKDLGITVTAYTKSIGPVSIDYDHFDINEIHNNAVCMPDAKASQEAEAFLQKQMEDMDSTGGVVECIVHGLPAGIGEPVFDKLDANLAKAMLSIGAVKGFEIGSGFEAASMAGSIQNDAFYSEDQKHVLKKTNYAGGVLGGISDGSDVVFRVAFKPTPSIFKKQETINQNKENIEVQIKGRHDPIVVPRAVVVVETMAAITITDLLFANMTSQMNKIKEFYQK
ncbi:chorismate synthase [[Clostridium] polysaccharolyticum]|uniref:Chorismate synthase n=1 Tax=[Clostridium] polysaccharolyticum TaxID=29364 RepID=A0A1H9YNG0_9FIRM|nr:chorismate synthase [[Clostridium] polysaccharolyticum]SES70603.1 chorismate synthase [[Clostridium] polysaccharolyticum]